MGAPLKEKVTCMVGSDGGRGAMMKDLSRCAPSLGRMM